MMILGTGIDIIEVERIKRAMDRWGDHFLRHVFNDEEIAYSKKYKFPAQHLAARFAAKEAIYKALPKGVHLSWKDVTILNDSDGKPYCLCSRKDFRNKILLSLSHTQNYAVASAIITP
jgi:holo-[acyl-carrier protein] synthase